MHDQRLIKTLRGHDALKTRQSGLTPRQRQVLILADGRRTQNDIFKLIGVVDAQDMHKLLNERYLVTGDAVESAETGFGDATAMGEMWDVSAFNHDVDAEDSEH